MTLRDFLTEMVASWEPIYVNRAGVSYTDTLTRASAKNVLKYMQPDVLAMKIKSISCTEENGTIIVYLNMPRDGEWGE